MRPMPASPASAISPALGPIMATPSRASCATLRRVAALLHISGFIAGASRIGRLVASRIAVARSSAWPCAIFAIRSAVAGATTIRSQSRASRIWPASNSLCGIEQVRVAVLAGQRAGGQRRDEVLRGAGQHAADMDVPLLQPPDQVQRLVGGDAAADDQGDAGLVGGGCRRTAAAERRPCGRGLGRRCGRGSGPARRRAGSPAPRLPPSGHGARHAAAARPGWRRRAFGWSGWP